MISNGVARTNDGNAIDVRTGSGINYNLKGGVVWVAAIVKNRKGIVIRSGRIMPCRFRVNSLARIIAVTEIPK